MAGALFLAFALLHVCTRPIGAGDVFWQLRTGEEILQGGGLPRADSYTYTIAGRPWNNHQWGYEVLLALFHGVFGWGGLRLLVLVLAGGATALIWWRAHRRLGPAWATALTAVFAVLASYKFLPAPQTLHLALFLVAREVFAGRAALAGRWRPIGLAALLLVWGNLTAEALIFLPFLVSEQLILALANRGGTSAPGPAGTPSPPPTRRVILVLAAACVAPLLNPPGSSVLEYALAGTWQNRLVNTEFSTLWAPAATVPAVAKNAARLIALVSLAHAVWSLRPGPDRPRRAVTAAHALLAVAAATVMERNIWLLVVPLTGITAEIVDRARAPRRLALASAAALLVAASLFAAFAAAVHWSPALAWRQLADPTYRAAHLDRHQLPLECAAALAADPAPRRLFTDRRWASYLIWRAPQIAVFVDGRIREFPLSVFRAEREILSGGPLAEGLLAESRTDLVLTRPGWRSAPAGSPSAWRPVGGAGNCVLYAPSAQRAPR